MIVGLCGYSKTGKDTLGGLLSEYKRIAFADHLKLEVTRMLATVGIEADLWGDDKEDYRGLLILWGELRRRQDPDYWIKRAYIKVTKAVELKEHVVITDVRYANEVKAIMRWGGKVVYITRPNYSACSPTEAESIDKINKLFDLPRIINDGKPREMERVFRDIIKQFNWTIRH